MQLTEVEHIALGRDLRRLVAMLGQLNDALARAHPWLARYIGRANRKVLKICAELERRYVTVYPPVTIDNPLHGIPTRRRGLTVDEHKRIGDFLHQLLDELDPPFGRHVRAGAIAIDHLANRVGPALGARFCDAAIDVERSLQLFQAGADTEFRQHHRDHYVGAVYYRERKVDPTPVAWLPSSRVPGLS